MLPVAFRQFRHNAIKPVKHLNQVALIARHQPLLSPSRLRYYASSTEQTDFRHIGTEKDAGALQDLLRRVMEIDAEITCTPVVDYKPNVKSIIIEASSGIDTFDLNSISHQLSSTDEFGIASHYESMLHIMDHHQGGDIYLFSNGTLVYWGLDMQRQDTFLNECIRKHLPKEEQGTDSIIKVYESKVMAEYTIDEDEMTDMKGNVILLNPHIPSIGLSKIAFSYGIGRAAKLSSIEKSIEVFSDQLNDTIPSLICDTKEMLCSSSNKKVMLGQLLSIQQRVFRGSRDGLLGTNGLHWAKPELEEYVDKISKHYDVHMRIQVLNKKLEYFHLSLKHF